MIRGIMIFGALCAATMGAPLCGWAADNKQGPVSYDGPQEVVFSGKGGAWETPKNWRGDKVPSADSFVSLRNAVSVSVSQKVSPITALHIGSTKATVLTIERGGVFEASDVRVWRNVSNSEGILNINGGEFKSNLISVGGCRTISSTGILNLNSGKLMGRIFVGSDLPRTGVGTLSINSSNAEVGSYSGRMQLAVAASGTVVFNLDGKGAPALDFVRSSVNFSEGSHLIVNGKGYTGGSKTLPLITSADFKDRGAILETKDFPVGLSAEIQKKSNGFFLKVESARR